MRQGPAKYKNHADSINSICRGGIAITSILANEFDLVIARNSLDHARDSLVAIQRMLFVAKPNSYVLLDHRVNEGEKQKLQKRPPMEFRD